MNIISASRRSDIPAFYMPWLMNRLRAGFVRYPNPYSGEVYTVSLLSEDVHSIVFWSKNYGPFLPYLNELSERGYRFYFHYTVTGGPRVLEPHVPNWHQSVRVFRELAELTSTRHVQWRFDPILFTAEKGPGFYLERFRQIAMELCGATQRCYFSFAVFYQKVQRRLREARVRFRDPSPAEKQSLVGEMEAIASECGITLYACCEDALGQNAIRKAHCVDGDLLAELFPERPRVSTRTPTRKGCGCVVSRDIGMYDSCPYDCLYCYANQNRQVAIENFRVHETQGEKLIE